jgi:hypothetical protein
MKHVLSDYDGLPKAVFRTRNLSVRRLSQKLHRIALGKCEKAEEQLRDDYQNLLSVAKVSRAQAVKVE